MTVKDDIEELEQKVDKINKTVNWLIWGFVRCTAAGVTICTTAGWLMSLVVEKWKPLQAAIVAYLKADGKL